MEEILIGQVVALEDESEVCVLFSDRASIVVPKKTLGEITHGSFIICKIKKGRKEKNIVQKIFTFHDNQVGEIVFENSEPFIELTCKKEQKIRIPCKYYKNLYDGLKVRFKLENTSSGIRAFVYQVLGDKVDLGIDIMDVAERSGIRTVFSKRALKQAECMKEPIFDYEKENRIDLSSKPIFTIDGAKSQDFDDAISLSEEGGKYILETHISDVDFHIPEGSPLDLEARKRGFSAYLLYYTSPMFPPQVSNGVCSLNEGVDRFTLTTRMQISKSGIIETVDCYPSMIRSKKRMTYESAEQVLKGKRVSGYNAFSDTLHEMYYVSELLYEKRMERGAVEFNSSEPIFELGCYGNVVNVGQRQKRKSEFIIQEFMLATNQSVPLIFDKLGIVYPHRIHLEPDIAKLREVAPKLKTLGVDITPLLLEEVENKSKILSQLLNECRREPYYHIVANLLMSCMRRAKYSTENIGHFGLAVPANVHFTAPIRRYTDLTNHRLIRKHYFHNLPQTDSEIEELTRISIDCSSYEKRINKCEEQIIRLKSREYLLANVGKTIDAVIKDCTNKGILIELRNCIEEWIPEEELEGAVFDKDNYRFTFKDCSIVYGLGTKIKVVIEKSPFDSKQIKFRIKEPNKTKFYSLQSKQSLL